MTARRWAAIAALAFITACVPKPSVAPPPAVPRQAPTPAPAPPPADAISVGVRPGPAALPITDEQAARALAAFRISCPSLLRRSDQSGIAADWRPACDRARTETDARQFFATAFEAAEVGNGNAMVTGYYEPEIAASREPLPGYVPIYRLPGDLVEQQVPVCPPQLDPLLPPPDPATCPLKKQRGRLVDGQFVPYFDRTEIDNGALAGRGLEIAWAADPVALFFLEIQGSGRLRFPDGTVMRVGYAGQNGWPYTGIGALMKQRGLLGPGQTSMQGIVAWLHEHPDEGKAIMQENRSYVFFRELTGPGPLGALGVPVTPRGSVAADPHFTPLGAPVFLDVDNPEADGLWVAQDTGGAIRGPNRFDTFWGPGDEAARIAGGLLARGRAWLLLPLGTLDRLAQGGTREGAPVKP
ncbi:murein transglycosylase A [Sphingomonas sp.]|uniref:murein transglycosylase A n=1 Tax=Sphingomonas sp. TaxID=28214 RepID=UPI002DBF527F|nr:murein transglycosylase A [Sphingomonas sp.]HEU4967796.1 murein transglycosylase A [Sphingomonas sp.]